MNTEKNNVSLDFRSYSENHDTDINVSINGDHVDESRLIKMLNTWLKAIGANLVVSAGD